MFAVIYLSRFSNFATRVHWVALTRVLRYLKTIIDMPFILKLNDEPSSKDTSSSTITIIADSDWAGDRSDKKSFSGRCVLIDGALVNFISSKQPTVSTSSTEAEYISTSEVCKEGLYFRNLLHELLLVIIPIKTLINNNKDIHYRKHQSGVCVNSVPRTVYGQFTVITEGLLT
jgi:hypothetical protein